jgi:hypothetical protein
MNTIATYHKKVITTQAQNVANIEVDAIVAEAGGVSLSYPWPFYFRTGENTIGIRFMVGVCDTGFASAANPRLEIAVNLASDGSAVSSGTVSFNGRGSLGSTFQIANRMSLTKIVLGSLSPNTAYYVNLSAIDGARPVYLTVFEVSELHADDSVTGVVDPSKFIEGGPIYDEHVQDLLDAGDKHWRHSGCHYLTWNPSNWNDLSVTATTYTNVLDGSSTTVTAATPGFTLASQYHGASHTPSAGHGVVIAVKAERTVGSGTLDVKFDDGTNTIALTGITTAGVGEWYTGTGSMPSQIAKWDILAKVSAGTFKLKAVCLYAYEV